MRKVKFTKLNPKYWWLYRKNKRLKYQVEYRNTLIECDGDIDCADMIMFLNAS